MKIVPISVKLKNPKGSDLDVVDAARVSFNKQSLWVESEDGQLTLSEKDKRLIRYLAKNNHWTPFAHCSATFIIKVPIFVARQIHKHQVGFTVNEVSRRYVDEEPEFYFPEHWRKRADNVKQGSSEEVFTGELANEIIFTVETRTKYGLLVYESLLKSGVCPEQARLILPLTTMTEFWMTGSLAAWARLCALRLDPHTQKETQEVAKLISNYCMDLWPVSWGELVHG